MESMFTRKKTVLETNLMINEISVDDIRTELRALKLKEDVQLTNLERQKKNGERL